MILIDSLEKIVAITETYWSVYIILYTKCKYYTVYDYIILIYKKHIYCIASYTDAIIKIYLEPLYLISIKVYYLILDIPKLGHDNN